MTDAILVLNAGSSSIKFSLFDGATARARSPSSAGRSSGICTAPRFIAKDAAGQTVGEKRWGDGRGDRARRRARAPRRLAARRSTAATIASRPSAIASSTAARDYTTPVRVDAAVLADAGEAGAARAAAPAAQPGADPDAARARCRRCRRWPASTRRSTARSRGVAQMFALPARAATTRGVRRYGFHGLSYEYIAVVLPDVRPARGARQDRRRSTSATAPACARCAAGRSVATRWASPRSTGCRWARARGALDPGVLLYLMDQRGMDARAIENADLHESGLLGVSGVSSDMRDAAAQSTEPRAALAVDLFVYRIGRELGSLAAALGGLDAIVFTGGIGEHDSARSASASAGTRPGSASSWTRRPTPPAARASARRAAAPPPG